MDIYGFIFSPWFWLVLTVLFTLIELLSAFTLTTIWFAISAALMIFISGLTELLDAPIRFRLHIGLFLVIAIVLLVFTRPIAIKKLKVGKTKTNVDALVNEDALVTKKIPTFGKGEIKVKGQTWTAISEDNTEIKEGVVCAVVRIEGVKAIVRRTAAGPVSSKS
jgi:membrane protein implicated in regulation of membrane protease activity